jgi:hypothetical protein
VPPPFSDEPTRQVDDDLLDALRSQPASIPSPPSRPSFGDEPTRMAKIDPRAYDETPIEERTRPAERERVATPSVAITTSPRPKFPPEAPTTAPSISEFDHGDEATRVGSLDGIAAMERARNSPALSQGNEERTRAVNIRNDPSFSDIDWDLD